MVLGIGTAMNNEFVTIDDQIKGSDYHNDSVTFDYELNDKAAKAKLVKGSKRIPFEVEENLTSITMIFSVGAWLTAVLPAARYWNEIKSDKTCKVGDISVRVGGIKAGKDANGMHVVSQVVFYADRDKVICHLYNTTQKILVNGHGYKRLVELFLKPFFHSKIESCPQEIQTLNEEVSLKFGAKTVKRSNIKYNSGSTVAQRFACSLCDLTFKTLSSLNKHKSANHTTTLSFNLSQNLMIPQQQSTRNNSLVENLMLEDVTTTDLATDSVTLDENLLEYNCTHCNFLTTSKHALGEHTDQQHKPNNTEDVMVVDDDATYENIIYIEILEYFISNPHINEKISESTSSKHDGKKKSEETHLEQNLGPIPAANSDFEEIVELTCRLCVFECETKDEIDEHIEKAHMIPKTHPCQLCEFKGKSKANLEKHIQIHHKTAKVDIKANDQIIFSCNICEYTCSLNIKLKRHMKTKHIQPTETNEKSNASQEETKYNCTSCTFRTNYLVKMYEHKLEEHPETSIEFNPNKASAKDMALNLIAEQNLEIMEEVLELKKLITSAIKDLAVDITSKFDTIVSDSKETDYRMQDSFNKLNNILNNKTTTEAKKSKDKEPLQSSPSSLKKSSSFQSQPPTAHERKQDEGSKQNTRRKSKYLQRTHVLYVGDSLAHNADFLSIEHNTNKRIRTSKAYSSTHDMRSRWPKKNIANVTARALSNTCADDKFTELILAAPSVDITNIDTAKVSTEENIKDFKQQMVTSCHNMFAVANEAIADHPELKRVILMEHAPRFDKKAIDPTGLKPKLALYANTIFAQMWQNSGTKERIIIGKHTRVCWRPNVRQVHG